MCADRASIMGRAAPRSKTVTCMPEVSISELRNRAGEVLDRVEAGARLTVTRAGRPIAELVQLRRLAVTAATLLEHWSQLPDFDPGVLRADVDTELDATL